MIFFVSVQSVGHVPTPQTLFLGKQFEELNQIKVKRDEVLDLLGN